MENPRGRVIAIERTETPRRALVEVDASVSCKRCAEGKGCGAGLLGAKTGQRRVDAIIDGGLVVSEGDEVRIELAPSNLLQASMIVYGFPLTGAVAGATISYFLGLGELFAAATALGGIVVGLLVARWRLREAHCLRRFTPTIVERMAVSR